jgi:hypothetical protein
MKNPITRITTCLALSLVIVNISYGQTDNMQAPAATQTAPLMASQTAPPGHRLLTR